jgi:hypothetical protein
MHRELPRVGNLTLRYTPRCFPLVVHGFFQESVMNLNTFGPSRARL